MQLLTIIFNHILTQEFLHILWLKKTHYIAFVALGTGQNPNSVASECIVTTWYLNVCFATVIFYFDIFSCPAVERSSAELQWLLTMVQNEPAHYVRSADSQHTILLYITVSSPQVFSLGFHVIRFRLPKCVVSFVIHYIITWNRYAARIL